MVAVCLNPSPLDVEALSAIFSASFPEDDPDWFRRRLHEGRWDVWVATIGGNIAGFGVVKPQGRPYLSLLGVAPALRSCGIGSQLLAAITSHPAYRNRLLAWVEPPSTPDAERRIAFYLRQGGAVVVSRCDDGWDLWLPGKAA